MSVHQCSESDWIQTSCRLSPRSFVLSSILLCAGLNSSQCTYDSIRACSLLKWVCSQSEDSALDSSVADHSKYLEGSREDMGSWFSSEGGSSSSSPPHGITMISDAVYSFSEPQGSPEMEIVFLHGLQLSDYKEAYWKTWVAGERDGNGEEVIWPATWLREEFPGARILSLCYDSSAIKTNTTGTMDGFTVGESLVQELVEIAKVGQQKNCPVVFVCHSLGGLIVKEIVIQAHRKFGKKPPYVTFLQNIRGFHFYATPHDGSKLADYFSHFPKMGKMVKKLEVINADLGRLNDQFEQIESENFANKWQFAVIAETNKTTSHGFSAMVVEEASARHGYVNFRPVKEDHFGVCKPKSRVSSSYKFLTEFISEVVKAEQTSSLTRVNPAQAHELC